ncbi:MAG: phospho-sugar mutase [Treponema sp.]|jgi:phosphoglucomutase|nr:phospho-sugar mutase [Treponema sp.]
MEKQEITARARRYISLESDAGFRGEVEALLAQEDWKELEDRFYRTLEFGTGGLRGVIGGGDNRMNTLVVKNATQGLASYLLRALPEKAAAGALSAAIAYDSRRYSKEFAEAAALIFAGNGIKAYLFSGMRPTPVLSFAIRALGCDTGIVVTASHNPPQYNGYKAYWAGGGQVIPPHDEGIIAEVNRVTSVHTLTRDEALERGLLVYIDKEIDGPYQAMVKRRLFRPALVREQAASLPIVYTPLHGTGAPQVEAILGGLGFKVTTVPEQREGDGAFPTVSYPNPEEAAALEMAITLGKKTGALLVMATDPDADRFGAAVPARDGAGFTLITGNQMGTLLADYLFLSLKETGTMPERPAMVNTIVTTGMQAAVAASYGVECFECLTGFKWIADLMRRAEADGSATIIFGDEESYGYLVENEVRDKDGVSAAALVAEMALYWRSQGKSLLDRLDDLYRAHGYWEETGVSKYFPGPEGPRTMAAIMEAYRAAPPAALGGIAVTKVRDILRSVTLFPGTPGKTEPIALPKSDVLQFCLADGTVVSARPSGTEPKIKFYASCRTEVGPGGLAEARAEAGRKLKAIKDDIIKVIGK